MDNDFLSSANELEKELKWAEAATLYERILEKTPSVDLYERAAWCFSRAGVYQKAIEYLIVLHEQEPLSAKWLYMIGYQYYCKKEWSLATEWFEKALILYPDYFVVKYRLAYAYIQTAGVYMKLTKAEYWKAIGHLKDCHNLWETFDDAKKQRERNTYFDVNFLHGKILMDLPRHYLDAISLFRKALSIRPNDEFARYNLAKTFYLSEDYQNAKANMPSGNQYYIVELTAYIEAKLGNYDKSISIIQKLLLRRKKDYLYSFLAEVYLLKSDLDKAYKAANEALLIGKANHKNFYITAKVYYEYGLFDKAIENLDCGIKLKRQKYDSGYSDCEDLKQKIIFEKPFNYEDDQGLIEKLSNQLTPQSMQGIIHKYNTEKGYGFIRQGTKDIFFHISNCKYNDIATGDKILFSTTATDKGLKAIDIIKVTKLK